MRHPRMPLALAAVLSSALAGPGHAAGSVSGMGFVGLDISKPRRSTMKQAVTFRSGISTFVLIFVLFASGVPTANAEHCGDGCVHISRDLDVKRTEDGRIDVSATLDLPQGGERTQIHNHNRTAFHVLNLGPHAIDRLAVAPSYYTGWGCANAFVAWNCNRLRGRIEAGQRILFQIFYDYYEEDMTTTIYDLGIGDSREAEVKEYKVRIPRSGPIPTLIVRTSSSNRANCQNAMKSVFREMLDTFTFDLTKEEACGDSWSEIETQLYIP